MSEPIVYIDRSEIRAGKLEEVKKAISQLVAFVDAHEPQLISYGIYIDEQASTMRVVAVHPDSASIEFHVEIGGPEFRKFAELIDLRSIEVHGRPSDAVLKQLRQKAEMLGENGRVLVHEFQAGFSRFHSARP
jgi:quinol monooxygenase YgiN